MVTLDARRRHADLALLAQGHEFAFGDAQGLPLSPQRLASLAADSDGVEAVHDGGLTARVFRLAAGGRRYAVKVARAHSLVRNDDGRTSFLNELRRHAELRELRAAGVVFPGVVAPLYGSLHAGVIVSPWVDGVSVDRFDDARRIRQVLASGVALLANGFFEWDFSPGNLIDDGTQVWLFDFGYMYRFDPLTQFSSAGNGDNCPQFHLAERIETRNAFAWLLELDRDAGRAAALAAFRDLKEASLDAYRALRTTLAGRGGRAAVLDWLDAIASAWSTALAGDLAALYLREGWRSHALDLEDDLRGQSCTARTLARADWLIETATRHRPALQAAGALFGTDLRLSPESLVQRYRARRAQAEGFLLRPTG